MKIYRNGVEIKLTERELYDAFREAQKLYDMDDVEQNFSYSDMVDMYGEKMNGIAGDEWRKAMPEVAEVYRDYLEGSDEWYYRLRDAAEYVLKGMKED